MNGERWQRIDQLFHQALEQEPPLREAFLAQACDGDVHLREELESLIKSHEQSRDFIETPASDVAAELLANGADRLEIGQNIGRYAIVAALGAGGMGDVYLAQDTQLERKIALKILPTQFTVDAERVRRFEQEARAASALNHPNIVTIHEIGTADSSHFIATEFVDGETLRQRMSHKRLQLNEALEIASQVASALSVAHAAGIVHRDIKPENIMLRRDGIVKVLDFGLAKLSLQAEPSIDVQPSNLSMVNTNPGMVMGTFPYLSPEQARAEEVDLRTDIWSLGVVLYEMVAAQTPFTGETPAHALSSILESKPPTLNHYVEAPAELERIVSKALRKERAERYQRVSEMALALNDLKKELEVESRLHQSPQPEAVGGESSATRGYAALNTAGTLSNRTTHSSIALWMPGAEYLIAGKHSKRNAVLAAMIVLLSIVSILYLSNFINGSEEIDSVAILPFLNEGGDPEVEYLADAINDSVIRSVSRLPELRVISLNTVMSYKGRQINEQAIGRELNVQAVLMGKMKQTGDSLAITAELVDVRDNRRLWGEQYNSKPSEILAVQEGIARAIAEKLRPRLGGAEKLQLTKQSTQNPEVYDAYARGRFLLDKGTAESAKRAIEYLEHAIKLDPNYGPALATLSYAYMALGDRAASQPREVLSKAKAAAEKALTVDETLAEAHVSLGYIRSTDWDWAGAERAFKRGIELNPGSAFAHSQYAFYLLSMKRFDEAVAESKRALEIDPVSVVSNRNVAITLYFARRYDEAIAQSQKALELDPNIPSVNRWLGKSYEQKGLYGEAVGAYLKTEEFSRYGPEAQAVLRETYATSGWKVFWRKALALKQELAKKSIVIEYMLAENYARLGEKDQAFERLEKGFEHRHHSMTLLNADPLWDAFRSDQRYADLVRRMGLEP